MSSLLDTLRTLYGRELSGGWDLAAALDALAYIESNRDPSAIGAAGEVSAWQVLTPSRWGLGPPPATLDDQARWIAPLVHDLVLVAPASLDDIPRYWRHGHLPAIPTPLDWVREIKFRAEYLRNARAPAGGGGAVLLLLGLLYLLSR